MTITPATIAELRDKASKFVYVYEPGVEIEGLLGTLLDALEAERAKNTLTAIKYDAGNGVTIELASKEPALWAIRQDGFVMARDGQFEYEPLPSSRTPEFLERCRFTFIEALAAIPHPTEGKRDE